MTGNRPLGDATVRLDLLVDAVKEYAIFMLDAEGFVASWNPGAQRIKGYEASEIIGRHFSVFYPVEDILAGKPERELAAAKSTGEYREEGWRIRKDGSMFWANVVITAVFDEWGRLAGFAKVTRDDSERRAVATAAEEARLTAEAANMAKDQFVSRMSHELRTPLNAILGFGQLLQSEELPSEHRESVTQIVDAGQHLLALINEVLDIARLSAGEVRLALEPVDVRDVVGKAVELIRPLATGRGVRISVHPSAISSRVVAHPRRLTQVVLNLLANAVKYNHEGGAVRLDGVTVGGRHRLTVTDTGIGIADADLGRLFQPFDRLAADATDVEGSGLGLALSRQLMSAMGGEIGVTSGLGLGSSFWIELPVTSDSVDRVADARVDTATTAQSPATSSRTVLYVEDNASNVRLVERLLARREEVTLLVADLGQRGLELARARRPDLILLDLHLPDMSGEEVLRELCLTPRTANIPVVVLSADAMPDRQRQLIAQGAHDFLTKPFDIARLLAIVDAVGPPERSGDDPDELVPFDGAALGANPAARAASAQADAFPAFAHDLNTLLGIILSYATLLSHDEADPAAAADLEEIRNAARRATELTKQFAARPRR